MPQSEKKTIKPSGANAKRGKKRATYGSRGSRGRENSSEGSHEAKRSGHRFLKNQGNQPFPLAIKVKPWGREIWFAHTSHYAGKILELKKSHRYSLQYHEKKEETQYVFRGKVKFTYGPDADHLKEKILMPGEKIHIFTGMIHRAEALEDSQIFEVSTPELDDVVKLHDDYGRSGKGNDEKLDRELAQTRATASVPQKD